MAGEDTAPWLVLLRPLYMEMDLRLIMKQATLTNSVALYYLPHRNTVLGCLIGVLQNLP